MILSYIINFSSYIPSYFIFNLINLRIKYIFISGEPNTIFKKYSGLLYYSLKFISILISIITFIPNNNYNLYFYFHNIVHLLPIPGAYIKGHILVHSLSRI